MAEFIDLEVSGLRELDRKLAALPIELTGKGASGPVAQALRKAAVIVQKAAIANAPDDPKTPIETSLKSGIRIIRDKNPGNVSERFVIDGNKKVAGKKVSWYWLFVELGTVQRAARPFMRRAMRDNAQLAVKTFSTELAKKIKAIERKLARQRA